MSSPIYKIVVLGEGTLPIIKDELAKPPSPSSMFAMNLTTNKDKLSMPAILRKKYDWITTNKLNSLSGYIW